MMSLFRELEQPQTSSSPCASIIPPRRRDWTGMGVCFQSVIGGCSSRQGPRRGLTAYVQRGPWHSPRSLGSSQSSRAGLFFCGQVPPWLVHLNCMAGSWLSVCLFQPPCFWTRRLCLDCLLLGAVLNRVNRVRF